MGIDVDALEPLTCRSIVRTTVVGIRKCHLICTINILLNCIKSREGNAIVLGGAKRKYKISL